MAGNIIKVKEGSYRLRYKDDSKYVKAKNDSTAERLLAKFITEVDSGDFEQPSKVTFKEFAKRWLKDYAEIELAPKTVFRYRQLLEARIYKAFGNKRLDRIKPLDLVEFYNGLRKDHKFTSMKKGGTTEERKSGPLSDQTIKHHHRLLSAMFEKAIKWDVLKGANPAKKVDAPKVEKKKAKCYNEKQVHELIDALDSIEPDELKYKVATMIALNTGARLGEIMGLEWKDIGELSKTITISKTSQYLPGVGVFEKGTKNESSERKVTINGALLNLLNEYKESQQSRGFLCQDNNRLFVMWNGTPMHPQTLTHWFPKFLVRNKLPHLNFHGLRHTSATFLISKGMDIQTIAGRLGHSTSATTQNIYSHFLESKDKRAASLFESTFNKKKKDRKKKSLS